MVVTLQILVSAELGQCKGWESFTGIRPQARLLQESLIILNLIRVDEVGEAISVLSNACVLKALILRVVFQLLDSCDLTPKALAVEVHEICFVAQPRTLDELRAPKPMVAIGIER